jgi:hypothetical protein
MKAERDEDRRRIAKGQSAPSITYSLEPPGTSAKGMAAAGDWKAKLNSEALVGKLKQNCFKVTMKSKESHSPETVKGLLKANINPTEIKVGINTLKTLRDGRVLIETGSKEEVEVLK